MKLLSEYELTVETAGEPEQVTANKSAQKVIIANNHSDGRIVVLGLEATVDALSNPPVGLMIGSGINGNMPVHYDASEVWVDASLDGTKVTVQIFG